MSGPGEKPTEQWSEPVHNLPAAKKRRETSKKRISVTRDEDIKAEVEGKRTKSYK